MTSGSKQKATVKTNDTPGSVCRINVEPVKFADLWKGYPGSPPYVDPKTGKPPPGYSNPDGHPKLLHLWPVKLLQAGRTDGDYTGVAVMREAASFNR